ncbi:hypothetical protein [Luteolibacter sp. LG18]|uniref:hypothetical protein n=1 Tax=Luteolibacter sp. LG18 TaxID=2819286 RepID=UPI002B31E6AB|nr:hypothetical protein llg_07190 [Luteolibacter sp. LG18]BCU79652.1 hypothetical protein llg_43670 [Luteolibacter sp. LG18]
MRPDGNHELDALPLFSWAEEKHVVSPRTGAKLPRWGSVAKACELLDDCDRETIYILIKSGAIRGYKRRPDRENSHWRVDLLSVWHHKQSQFRQIG